MKRNIIITIVTDDTAESAKFEELMDNLVDTCHEAANELVAEDSIENGAYFFSLYDPAKSNVRIESRWEEEGLRKK
jgi:hypothetical protein